MIRKSFVAIALGVAITSSALAAERCIEKSEVPRVVLNVTISRYPKAEMTGSVQPAGERTRTDR